MEESEVGDGPLAAAKKHILVVDDDPVVVQVVTALLEGKGYRVSSAADAHAAFDTARRERPALIILDLLLPGMDGFQICRMLRHFDETRDTPVIILTGIYDSPIDIRRGIRMGADRYLLKSSEAVMGKPFNPDEMLQVVEEVLSGSRRVAHLPSERILIVEDDELNASLLRRSLESVGYEVLMAGDGPEGLEMIKQELPDVVLLDYRLPGLDGLHVLEQGRQQSPNSVFVFMTAYSSQDLTVEALRRGADDYLIKPFRPWNVTAVVEENLQKTRQRRLTRSLIDELNRTNERLGVQQAELRSRNAALQQAYAQLQQVDRMREDLLGMVIHDLRNPLSIMISTMELLADDYLPIMDHEQQDVLANARRAGQQLTGMVSNLLDVQRLEAGKMPLLVSDVDVRDLVSHTIAVARPRLRERQIASSLELAPDIPIIRADPMVLGRILDNLIDNSIKYTPAGGSITISVELQNQQVIVSVGDTGPGIPETARERIFDKFEQLRNAHEPRSGSGLGLTFCRLATEAHGGRIWVESNAPQGSRFRFALPLIATTAPGPLL